MSDQLPDGLEPEIRNLGWKPGGTNSGVSKRKRADVMLETDAAVAKVQKENPDWTIQQIAQNTGLSVAQVKRARERIRKRYEDIISANVQEIRADEVGHLTAIVAEAMRAWEESRKNAVTIDRTTRQTLTREGTIVSLVDEKKSITGRLPNPQYLNLALAGRAQIAKITGIERADIKIEINIATRQALVDGIVAIILPHLPMDQMTVESVGSALHQTIGKILGMPKEENEILELKALPAPEGNDDANL